MKRKAKARKIVSEHFKHHFNYLQVNDVQQKVHWLIWHFLSLKASEPWPCTHTVSVLSIHYKDIKHCAITNTCTQENFYFMYNNFIITFVSSKHMSNIALACGLVCFTQKKGSGVTYSSSWFVWPPFNFTDHVFV